MPSSCPYLKYTLLAFLWQFLHFSTEYCYRAGYHCLKPLIGIAVAFQIWGWNLLRKEDVVQFATLDLEAGGWGDKRVPRTLASWWENHFKCSSTYTIAEPDINQIRDGISTSSTSLHKWGKEVTVSLQDNAMFCLFWMFYPYMDPTLLKIPLSQAWLQMFEWTSPCNLMTVLVKWFYFWGCFFNLLLLVEVIALRCLDRLSKYSLI